MGPRFGLDQGSDDSPAVVRERPVVVFGPLPSAPRNPHQRSTAGLRRMPADCEPPSGPCLLSAAHYGASSRPVDGGHPIVSHSHKPGLAGSSGKPVYCEPPSGPCLRFLQSGHIAERWRLEPDEELDG